jgi:RNA polymerase sigma-70 factor, ECF subfamily
MHTSGSDTTISIEAARSQSRQVDLDIASQLARGDAGTIEEFCSQYANEVARYARRFAGLLGAQDLEDITQNVLIAAIQSARAYRGESSLKTWVLRIAHHKLVDLARSATSRNQHETVFAEMPETWEPAWPEQPEDILVAQDFVERVGSALECLPPLERAVLTLRYMHGMDVDQTAQIINKSRRAAQKILTQARAHIRELLLPLAEERGDA